MRPRVAHISDESAECVNTDGGFECTCRVGFAATEDGCQPMLFAGSSSVEGEVSRARRTVDCCRDRSDRPENLLK